MQPHLIRFVNLYVKAILKNNAAIFAGAGLSIPSGFVNWKTLMKEIASDLDLDIDKEDDLIAIAQYHINEHGGNRNRLNQLLIDEFIRDAAVTPNHQLLASLPIQTYWTTNYDKIIEKALDLEGKTPDVKISSENLTHNVAKRDAVIYKMHGDISLPEQAVLTKDDYESYNEKRQLFTTALQSDLISKNFLFIGFSFDDPNLGYILSRIRILLGQNQSDHYCFFKRVQRNDFSSDQAFHYAEVQHKLKINDLRRYSINALLIDDYQEITQVLEWIRKKVLRLSLFISGAALDYAPWTKDESLEFVHRLCQQLAAKNYRIVSGFGNGIGDAVVNGVLEWVFSTKYRHLDNALILRPFPQYVTGTSKKEERNTHYRTEMIRHAGIAIFIFGNKDDGAGGQRNSNGMIEEFEICIQQGVVPLPVGATGYAARELWERVMTEPLRYYPDEPRLLRLLEKLGNAAATRTELLDTVLQAVALLQELN